MIELDYILSVVDCRIGKDRNRATYYNNLVRSDGSLEHDGRTRGIRCSQFLMYSEGDRNGIS